MTHRFDLRLSGGVTVDGTPVTIEVSGGVITAVDADHPAGGDHEVDLDGSTVIPGFVDLQVNGAFGWDITDDPATMWSVGEGIRAHGVTAFLPTLVSTDLDHIDEARRVVAAGPPEGYRGATVLGLHIEGPFINPLRRGAHDPDELRLPSPDLVREWSPANGVRVVTIAPELPGALETIEALVSQEVMVSAGHSEATYDEAVAAFDRGVRLVTHLFNAMSGVEHRNPGLAAAALADPRVTAGMILDLIHVHTGAVRAAWAALGVDRLLLVTDVAAVAGADAAHGLLGNQQVTTSDGAPRLSSGVLAGSVLTLDVAVRNHVATISAGLAAAVAAVTTVPAGLMGLERRIAVGAPADLTILDENLAIAGTVVDGHYLGSTS